MGKRKPRYSPEVQVLLSKIGELGRARLRHKQRMDQTALEMRPLLQHVWNLGHPVGMTLQELGNEAGYTRERVRQLVDPTSVSDDS